MLSFLTIHLISFPFLVISMSHVSDLSIMLRIYQSLGNQLATETWDSTTSPCSWSGIDCIGKTVVGVSLVYQHINQKIPNEFANLTSLEALDLSSNSFTGKIPSELFLLKNLKSLNLNSNMLTGEIPDIIEAPDLVEIDLSVNILNGSIPEAIWKIPSLKRLMLAHNQLSGHLPPDICQESLEFLDISYNTISGPIPSSFINCKNLQEFDARNNLLSGTLPAALGSLPSLQYIYMSHNNLSGQIPPELARVLTLDLCSNCFSGQIPDAFHNRKGYYYFLNNAHLCSKIKIPNIPQCPSSQDKYLVAIIVTGAIIFVVFMYLIYRRVNKGRQEQHSSEQQTWELKAFHRLNFAETTILASLTDNNMIGSGGSGKVYKISVNDSGDTVAVKRIFNSKKLDEALEKQFLTEIEILGTFRHANIVKLLCCVSKEQVKLLVYEYMENQSLDRWLGKKRGVEEPSSMGNPDFNTIIDWPVRLRIAIGAAKGLCYLHHDCSPPIIHRDVKSSNILLDTEFNAKIADFGLAKMAIITGEPQTASAIAGSFGYIAPEYWRTKRLNEKIDVYSFGVVLLELATGKDPCKGNDHLNLADWSWEHCCKEHHIFDALDEDIKAPNFMEQMVNVFKLGVICTSKMPSSRPSMKEVLQLLISFNQLEASDQTYTANEE